MFPDGDFTSSGSPPVMPTWNMPILPSLRVHDEPTQLLREARESGSAFYTVVGPSGIGKTVWTEQLHTTAQSWSNNHLERWRVVHVSALEHEAHAPFSLAERIVLTAGKAADIEMLRPQATPESLTAINDNDKARTEDQLARERPMSIALRFATASYSALSRGLSSRRRLLLIVDDAQWVDEQSIQVLRSVVAQSWPMGCCVVFVGRSPRVSATSEAVGNAARQPWGVRRELRLLPLAARQVRTYALAVHHLEISYALSKRLSEASFGLPLLLDRAVNALHDVLAQRVSASTRDRTQFDEDVPDKLITDALAAATPFSGWLADLSEAARVAVQIVAVLRVPLTCQECNAVSRRLGVNTSFEEAIQVGLLAASESSGRRTRRGTGPSFSLFHDLLAAGISRELPSHYRAAILRAGAATISTRDPEGRFRSVRWRLEAHQIEQTPPEKVVLEQLDEVVAESVRAKHTERVFRIMQHAIDATTDSAPKLSNALMLQLYTLAAALAVLPRMLPFIPRIEALPSCPLRDLALLHIRALHGDYDWAYRFGGELLAKLPTEAHQRNSQIKSEPHWGAQFAEPEAQLIRAHVHLVLGMIATPASGGRDFGVTHLRLARELSAVLCEKPELSTGVLDTALHWLPSAYDILLRATGLLLYGASSLGDAELASREFEALTRAIDAAPEESSALFDALVFRSGYFTDYGNIALAYNDLVRTREMFLRGAAGWAEGMARAQFIYCGYLLGNLAEVSKTLQTSEMVILDVMDVASRPVFYALLAVISAEAGTEAGWESSIQAMAHTTVTDYETVGAEIEMWAHIALARLHGDSNAQLAVFDTEGPFAARLLRSPDIRAFKVDALAALGRAEEADRELELLRNSAAPGFTGVHGSLKWLEGRVLEAYGYHREAVRAYTEDVARSGAGYPAAKARAAADAGRVMLRTGSDRRRARRYLRIALDIFTRMGMTPDAVRVGQLLDAARTGLDSAASAPASAREQLFASIRGIDLLTPRERDVVMFATRGASNAEIAASCGISVSTVCFHMSNILKKLELSSRRELLSPHLYADLQYAAMASQPRTNARLTARERQVVSLAKADRSNAEIAEELRISYSTVAFHLENALRKLGLGSRRQLLG